MTRLWDGVELARLGQSACGVVVGLPESGQHPRGQEGGGHILYVELHRAPKNIHHPGDEGEDG